MTTPPPIRAATVRAVTYRRVSTHRQLGGTSPETQLERGEAIITENGWMNVGDFFDGGVSGAKASRKELDRLFEMCRAGLVDVVVVGDLTRLSRDMRNSLNFEFELAQLGVKVIDLDNPNADEMARMFTYMHGHWMRDQIRKTTHRGVLAVAKAGYWPGAPPPFGWQLAPAPDNPKRKIVVTNEAEKTTILTAIELYVDQRLTCWEAAAKLNALGLFTRTGARWSHVNLRRMLRRDYLTGDYTFHSDSGDFTITGPQIIDADRMAQLRKRLAETSIGTRPGNHIYPLTGRVVGPCGKSYHGTYRNDRDLRRYSCLTSYTRYDDRFENLGRRCRCPHVEANWLEQTVWAAVAKELSDPERLLALAQRYLDLRAEELPAEAEQISSLERRLADAKRKRTNLALAAAATGPEVVADALAEINRDIETLQEMAEQARAWAQANAQRAALVRDLEAFAATARERLDHPPTPEEMREVFVKLDIRVQVSREGIYQRRHFRPSLWISGALRDLEAPEDSVRSLKGSGASPFPHQFRRRPAGSIM